jgi:hypothetical protein
VLKGLALAAETPEGLADVRFVPKASFRAAEKQRPVRSLYKLFR